MKISLRYPPSEPCSCDICRAYCSRPGWWIPEEAEKAVKKGFGNRMMLELSPDRSFAVLSPAFKGNELNFALQIFSANGCTFLNDSLCELYHTGLQPLECRYCHHLRKGKGDECHRAIEKEWQKPAAKKIIIRWGNITGFWKMHGLSVAEK